MIETLFFYFFAAAAVLSALYVVISNQPARAALALLVTMFCLGGFYVLLRAFFIAVVHILVYAGAVLVMFLFVLMLLGLKHEDFQKNLRQEIMQIVAAGTSLLLFIQIILISQVFWIKPKEIAERAVGSIEVIGQVLFTQYLLPFEITSILLLVGIVGAVVLAKKEA